MGTRADFYIGLKDLKWIGSIYQDGHPWSIACKVLIQTNPTMFEETVVDFIKLKEGVVESEGGEWPWPWPDSELTDYSYIFVESPGAVYAYSMHDKIMFYPLKIMQGEDLKGARVFLQKPKFPKLGVDYGSDAA